MWNDVVTLFREYMGTGLTVIWFLISLIYLLVTEKRKPVRILFLYVPVILLLLFFNPLFARLVYGVAGDEIYYRILWLLPITVVIAFGAVTLYSRVKGRGKHALLLCLAALVAVSGSYIYSNPFFHKAENLYHMPQSVVDICDAIEVEGREVMAVFPAELLQYVRQYSPVICMPYGREITVERWSHLSELYDEMEAEEIDPGRLAQQAKLEMCHYVILPEDKKINGDLEQYDYRVFDRIGGYVIYRDISSEWWNFQDMPEKKTGKA